METSDSPPWCTRGRCSGVARPSLSSRSACWGKPPPSARLAPASVRGSGALPRARAPKGRLSGRLSGCVKICTGTACGVSGHGCEPSAACEAFASVRGGASQVLFRNPRPDFVNGGFQTVVRVSSGEQISPPPVNLNYQKNPRAHKNRIGTPPPPKPKIPPPLKRGIYGHGFFLQKEHIFSRRP